MGVAERIRAVLDLWGSGNLAMAGMGHDVEAMDAAIASLPDPDALQELADAARAIYHPDAPCFGYVGRCVYCNLRNALDLVEGKVPY